MSSNRCRPEALARVSLHFFTTPNALQELGWGMMQHPAGKYVARLDVALHPSCIGTAGFLRTYTNFR
jgi:hypothetical protein